MRFFFGGYIKDCVYVPALPCNLTRVKERFEHAFAAINFDILQRVEELDFRIDVCRVTKDVHIEHL